jgi:hypothetical protein
MMTGSSRRLVGVVAMSSVLAACAHQPPDLTAAHGQDVVDVREEHPTFNRIADICADRDVICILAGLAIFGGTVAAIKSSD